MLPPYGKILKAYLDANIVLPYSLMLFVGKNAFKEAKALMPYQICLCLPPNEDVANYEWPVKGLRIVVDDTGGMTTEALQTIGWYLICEQADMVCLHSQLFPLEVLLNKDIV